MSRRMRLPSTVLLTLTMVGVTMVFLVRGQAGTSQDAPPGSTPMPRTFDFPGQLEPTKVPLSQIHPNGFSLSEPIPTSIELELGGETFVVPMGATVVEVREGPPALHRKPRLHKNVSTCTESPR